MVQTNIFIWALAFWLFVLGLIAKEPERVKSAEHNVTVVEKSYVPERHK